MRAPKRIILFAPDETRRSILKFLLETWGYRVIPVATFDAALESLYKRPADAIIAPLCHYLDLQGAFPCLPILEARTEATGAMLREYVKNSVARKRGPTVHVTNERAA